MRDLRLVEVNTIWQQVLRSEVQPAILKSGTSRRYVHLYLYGVKVILAGLLVAKQA